ncbi:ABC transporter substrate-binding protein [Corynebacterium uterequi]|uniref:Extracellular solute-binding protein, family 5 n=1 Tax=Corynebacterium uterequi TaxID=1072256 RepID=A0A0G3HH38_9CORY|nr:ABC transporter substrate-binding protein [Corynebacterium uterequi]AKK11233.1 extracellular solute-binding protein, family 5 [Corynebacterium uterequi]
MNRRRALVSSALLTTIIATGCSPGAEEGASRADGVGYVLNSPLVTTNAASREGVGVNAEQVAARIYPGAFIAGPNGKIIPNVDLVSADELPTDSLQVSYTIADNAVFSDGNPITCVDFQLAYAAGAMPDLFDSHQPIAQDVAGFECQPEAKRFRVTFAEGRGQRWREMFGPGTVLPAHTIAAAAGMDEAQLHNALDAGDRAQLAGVADIWNHGFRLAEFDPTLQVSSGPLRIDSVGEAGEVHLVANPAYYGAPAAEPAITLWPSSSDAAELASNGALQVAETPVAVPAWVNRDNPDNPYHVESQVGLLTEALRFSDTGPLAEPDNRRALAACIDRSAIAAVSSEASGVEVPPVAVHTVYHIDPVRHRLEDIAAEYGSVDPQEAELLSATTVRIGYAGPNERYARMVEAIAAGCESAGITVVDAGVDSASMADLGRAYVDAEGTPSWTEGTIDAYLGAVDPQAEHSSVSSNARDLEQLRVEEQRLWQELPLLPLSAQPRAFVFDKAVGNVVVYTGPAGIGWNVDRWQVSDEKATSESPE